MKIMVDSQYNFYMESIDSAPELSATRFKKVQFNKNNYLDELVPFFFKDFPVDLAFSVKYDSDNDNMSTDFSLQYDDTYLSGARNIIDNKNYTEEFEYFAPLYVFKHAIPKYFIIFRVDGPGLVNLTKDNFRSEFLQKLKTVKLFDLTKKTPFGEWIYNNFSNNINFPVAPLDVDFNELEFTKWIGIDYDSGGYVSKSFYLDENLENENNLFDFERLFFDGYRINKVIFPHILNLSYLFDDTPATPTSLRKWSLNRYAGFYLEDIEVIDSITPFVLPKLHNDVTIYGPTGSGNIISSDSYGDPFVDGYRTDIDMWVECEGNFYLVKKFEETLSTSVSAISKGSSNKKVLVDSVNNPVVIKYRIISDVNLSGKESLLNKKSVYIDDQNRLVDLNSNAYVISNLTFADINLIEIDGVYHNLTIEDGYIKVISDYGFKFNENNSFSYYTNSGEDGYIKTIDLLIGNTNSPINFKVYRVKFSDIKDFDTNLVDSEFSRFEYEKRNDLTKTEETKMMLTDLRSTSSPQDFDDFIFKGKVENIPVASDYTANWETFRISDKKLSDIWRKNPIHTRWAYQNSLSAYDYPYLLNNNDIHEDFNRTSDTQNLIPNRTSRNLDYFYTVNSGTTSYLFHSLHVEKNYGSSQDSSHRFEVDKYLELGSYSLSGLEYSYDFNYFDIFFSCTQSFIDGELLLNRKKYSLFEAGDNVIPNTTLFRGLKFRLFEVDNIKYNSTFIENINLAASNLFQDYKFSILLSSNDWMVSNDGGLYKPYEWDYFMDTTRSFDHLALLTSYSATPSNFNIGDFIEIDQFYPYQTPQYQATASIVATYGALQSFGYGVNLDKMYSTSSYQQPGIWRKKMQWGVIKNWEFDKEYQIGEYLFYEGLVFKVIIGNPISDPYSNPISLTSSYQIETSFTQFWNPLTSYTNIGSTSSWVYKFDEYYYYYNPSGFDFWNPSITYSSGVYVIYDNRAYISNTSVPIGVHPVTQNRKIQSSNSTNYWSEVTFQIGIGSSYPKWAPVQLWDKNLISYSSNTLICYNDILYFTDSGASSNDIPGQSSSWRRVYSFISDTSYNYQPNDNSVIKINDGYYYCKYNPNLTIDSGITIFINKKWKNVLVNISINDNTILGNDNIMDETRNIERDNLYKETNGRLTAANFIRQINDLDSLYGFADYTSYVIIEEDGSISKYKFGNNLENLPYLLICEEPDLLNVKNNSLSYIPNTIDKTNLKPYRYLIDGQIDNLEKIDFYNNLPLGVEINNVKSEDRILKNLNNQKSNIFKKIYRHSGYYMPVFYDIELFTNASLYDSGSLCDVQFILETDGSLITFKFQSGDLNSEVDIILDIPSGDTQQDWETYYQQIIDLIMTQDIFFGKNFNFSVYSPGDSNIHPQIEGGHYVLSAKYQSDVCDVRISASRKVVCESILRYLFESNSFSAEAIVGDINYGLTIPKSEQTLCCPDCGPQFISYLQYSVGPENLSSIKTPFQDFLETLSPVDCIVSATAGSPIEGEYMTTPAWGNFESYVNLNSITVSNSLDFGDAYQELYDILPSVISRGIGQYGYPEILPELLDLISQVSSNQLSLLSSILTNGLMIYCDDDNYYVRKFYL